MPNRYLLFHPESDALFIVDSLEKRDECLIGGYVEDVTGIAEFEKRFKGPGSLNAETQSQSHRSIKMSFSPEEFLHATFTEANDTQMIPIPVGEYAARIESIEFKNGVSNKDGSPWLKLTVKWGLEDYALQETLGRTPSCFQDIWMDITESGFLDMGKGKNIGLGRLRDAVGLNVPGEPFSPSMLPGRAARVKVEQEPYKDRILSKITAVTKLG